MAWKKVIVSGSQAELANLVVDSNVTASAFSGDGSGLSFVGTSIVSGSEQIIGNLVNQDVNLGTGNISASNLQLSGDANIDGNIVLGGTITLGDADTDNIILSGELSSSIIPDGDNVYDLGSTAKEWSTVYANTISSSFISASSFEGDGSRLTNITVSQAATVSSTFSNQTSVAVNHNFDSKNVNVAVYDDNDTLILPASVTLTNNDTVTVTFDSSTSGHIVVAKGGHVVSGSIAASNIDGLDAKIAELGYATTGSNTFEGNQVYAGHLLPQESASYDLGSVDKPWRDLFLSTASLKLVDENGVVVKTINSENIVTTDEIDAGIIDLKGTLPEGVVSSSAEGSAQGTISLNGSDVNINGLQSSDSPQFSSLTLTGDLVVQGTTTSIETANLLVEDKFILLNSGSGAPQEGGLIIDEGNGTGHAFVFDSTSARFGFTGSLSHDSTSTAPDAFVGAVVDIDAGHQDVSEYQKNGNIKTDGGTVYIYA